MNSHRFYTPPLCTPSRASLMTGKYPLKTGMQHFVIPSDEPWGLPLEEKIMPEYFKEVGYTTRLIGKWHLGFFQQQYAPTRRGFDSFFGYLGPYIDYNDYTLNMFDRNYSRGYDMRRNMNIAKDFTPKYATDIFTEEAVRVISEHQGKTPLYLQLNHLSPHAGNEDNPMQAPPDEIAKFSYIPDIKRRTLAAMVSVLDKGVGDVVKALKANKMLENTIIVFYSDNGGPTVGLHSTNASNYPLRGQKQSGWEGAIRTNAIVYAPFLRSSGIRNQLIHVCDLLPTLGWLAGVKFNYQSKLDGINQWNVINQASLPTLRTEIVNIDDVLKFSSYISWPYKIVQGTLADGAYDGWLSSRSSSNISNNFDMVSYAINVISSVASRAILGIQKLNRLKLDTIFNMQWLATVTCSKNTAKSLCNLKKAPCLFNIFEDPCEENNLANVHPVVMKRLLLNLEKWNQRVVPSNRKSPDNACDPSNFNMTWNWWQPDQ